MAGQTWEAESTPYLQPQHKSSGDTWAEEAARRNRRGTQRIAEVRELDPPPAIAAALELEPGQAAVVRRRIMYLDGQPVELTDSYYPAAIARTTRLAEQRKIPGGAVTLLAELGHAIREVVENVTVDLPAPETRRALALPEGEPVLILTRTSYTTSRRPVEVSTMTMPRGHRLTYRMQVG